jgi:predicted ArsR family transcriptional regulator
MDARELADRVGLHHNTVRAHLRVLERGGLVDRAPEPRDRPGRPRMVYRALPLPEDRYELLSKILATLVAQAVPDAPAGADAAGRAWGRVLARGEEDGSPETQVARMVGLLADLGFDPELTAADGGGRILLHACPFVEVAREDPAVVCSVHLGIMRGALEELGGLVEATGLDPFVEPDLCIAHLAIAADRDREREPAGPPPGSEVSGT